MHTIGDVLPIPSMWVTPVAFDTSIKPKGLFQWPLELSRRVIGTFSPRHRIPDSPVPAIALEEVPRNSHRDIHTVLILQTSECQTLCCALLASDGGIRTEFFCQRRCSHLFVGRELKFGSPRICYRGARHLRAERSG